MQLTSPPPRSPPNISGPNSSPTITGENTAIAPGNTIFFNAASVAISTHFWLSGFPVPSINPGISLNCLLISLIMLYAASPTAVIVSDATRKGIMPPINNPIRTFVSVSKSCIGASRPWLTSWTKAVMIAKAANAAAPIAKPFPMAAVVLPTSSKLSVIFLVSGPRAPISAIPPALSAIGPYASIAIVIPTVASIPTAAIPTPYNPAK